MISKIIYIIIISLALSGCKCRRSNDNPTYITQKNNKGQTQKPALPLLDTSIILSGIKNIKLNDRNITEKEAEDFLYKYFQGKGVKNGNKVSRVAEASNLCVNYDTIYKVHSNRYSGAIISYWLGPCDLNGHCFQPTKAFIVATKNGFEIINEGFIPSNFAVDSTVESEIYGYDYDCGEQGIKRHIKLTLK